MVRESFIFQIDGKDADLRMSLELHHDEDYAVLTVFSSSFSTRIVPIAEGSVDTEEGEDTFPLSFTIPAVVETEYGEQILDRVAVDLGIVGLTVIPAGGNEYVPIHGWFRKKIPLETASAMIEYFPEGWLRYHSATYRKGKEERTVVDVKR